MTAKVTVNDDIQAAKIKKMTEEPVDKLILEMAVPTIVSNALLHQSIIWQIRIFTWEE